MAQSVRKRSEIEPRYKWDLTHIYASQQEWETAYASAPALIEALAAMDGQVAEKPEEAIRLYFATQEKLMKVVEYAFLSREADNADPAAQAMAEKANGLWTRFATAASFLEPELLAMDEQALQGLSTSPAMKDYDNFLRTLTRQKAHTLPKEQERLISMMGDVAHAPSTIFEMLTSVDMKFPDVTMADGSSATLTEGNYSSFIHAEDRDVRRQAFEGIMGTYGKFGSTIASIYGGSVKNDVFQARAHRFASARAMAMEPLEIPETVYDNMIQVAHEALPILQDYLRLRKKLMHLDELHLYDLYTPIVTDYHMDLPYEKAFDLVLEGLQPMGQDYVAKLREARDGGWIDVYPAEGKSSGAFSAGSLADVHPYVLLNHNDDLNSTFTIAHELGHSMHSFYSNTTQPAAKRDYAMFVAEVASICNECVMLRHLRGVFPEKKAQAWLLNNFLEDFRTTCLRQVMFAEFEKIVHEMAERDEPLTREALSDAYLALNRTYYGESCVIDPLIANEWMRIPHFYSAFYVYVYATGLCAAVTLSERILNEGESAVADYRRFLSAGCSVPPLEALKLAGIDMSSPEPLRRAMQVFRETLEQFRAAVEEE